ncbi:MAG: Mut7-C RNAse domain-containing protein [Candidatus Omnitrophica bacterium]|nr:Mut7-C RNAse domain-containing protein [Candidatus Omnitrophota bacterium]HOX54906.1 Mut7-C RNAse domain-containing protein [Candidatus Omnitrophota bacterium]
MKFIATKELGRLAKWMRILGFDTEYFKEENYPKLKIIALRDQRIILTRNTRMSQPKGIRLVQVKHDFLDEQLRDISQEIDLKAEKNSMFSRCTICNVGLEAVEKENIKDKVPEYVFKTQDKFLQCPNCHRIYWSGTHWGNVEKILKEVSL